MKIKNDEYGITYIAKYNENIIAISTDKDIIKEYMKNIRKLNKNEYDIEEFEADTSYYYIQYEDYVLTEFYSFFIPLIDIRIIEMEYSSIDKDLTSLLNRLKYFSFLFNRIEDDTTLNHSIELIKDIENISNKNKKMEKLSKAHYLNHPILSCNINQYFNFIKRYKEYQDLEKRYKERCSLD